MGLGSLIIEYRQPTPQCHRRGDCPANLINQKPETRNLKPFLSVFIRVRLWFNSGRLGTIIPVNFGRKPEKMGENRRKKEKSGENRRKPRKTGENWRETEEI
jgi:hypothetical protein